MLADVRFGSWPCKNVWERDGVALAMGAGFSGHYALIAAISGRTPMMLMTRVIL